MLADLRSITGSRVGIVRDAGGLIEAAESIERLAVSAPDPRGRAEVELANLFEVARVVVASALAREESRGAHTRAEWDGPRDCWRVRIVHGSRELLEGVLEGAGVVTHGADGDRPGGDGPCGDRPCGDRSGKGGT